MLSLPFHKPHAKHAHWLSLTNLAYPRDSYALCHFLPHFHCFVFHYPIGSAFIFDTVYRYLNGQHLTSALHAFSCIIVPRSNLICNLSFLNVFSLYVCPLSPAVHISVSITLISRLCAWPLHCPVSSLHNCFSVLPQTAPFSSRYFPLLCEMWCQRWKKVMWVPQFSKRCLLSCNPLFHIFSLTWKPKVKTF
jgi:hypothetical protein